MQIQKSGAERWKLEVGAGSWKLDAGSCNLEVGSWKLQSGIPQIRPEMRSITVTPERKRYLRSKNNSSRPRTLHSRVGGYIYYIYIYMCVYGKGERERERERERQGELQTNKCKMGGI